MNDSSLNNNSKKISNKIMVMAAVAGDEFAAFVDYLKVRPLHGARNSEHAKWGNCLSL